jgi:uncharacterized protein (DUF3820 family)
MGKRTQRIERRLRMTDEEEFAALTAADWVRVAVWAPSESKFDAAMRKWLKFPSSIEIMPLGKYKGVSFYDIPTSYLEWWLENIETDDETSSLSQRVLDTVVTHLKVR